MEMRDTADVLIFAEDPGAANYVARLPSLLQEHGWRSRLIAAGSATAFLRASMPDVEFEELPEDTQADGLLASTRPRLVVIGTSENLDTLGLALVPVARTAGVPIVGAVDAFPNAAFRFRGRRRRPLAYAPDWLIVPDEWTREAYVALGFPGERAVICGHPHYDFVRRVGARLANEDRALLRRRQLPGAPRDRAVIVFASEISTGLNPRQFRRSAAYTLTGRSRSVGRTQVVLEEFLEAAALLASRPYLVLRPHPKDSPEELAPYLAEFDAVISQGSALQLVYLADLVVGMTSMLLLEAALLGRPTLSIVPRAQEGDWLPIARSGITPCVSDRQELRRTLAHLVECPPSESATPVDAMIPADSSRRTREFLDRLLFGVRWPAHEHARGKG
jgi:hypothetical protein